MELDERLAIAVEYIMYVWMATIVMFSLVYL